MNNSKMTDDELAQILWDYNSLEQSVEKADLLFVPCSSDVRGARKAAELFLKGYAPYILFSGKQGMVSKNLFNKPEAEVFAAEAIKAGVPAGVILTETESTNTGENIEFSKKLLKECELDIKKMIIVQKPYALRRMYATFKKQWPEVEIFLATFDTTFEQYPNDVLTKEMLINALVKTTNRIIDYPEKGFQIPQEMSEEVMNAMQELINRGYNKRIVAE